jgi:hypothetical protein
MGDAVAGHSNRANRGLPDGAPHYSAERARGGEIVLRTRVERLIFIAGLVGAVILALLFAWS